MTAIRIIGRWVTATAVAFALGLTAVSLQAQRGGGAAPPTLEALRAMPTPRGADGKPILTGWWGGGFGGGLFAGAAGPPPEGDVFAVMQARDGRLENLENDSYVSQKSEDDVPLYKPEFWAQVRENDYFGNQRDPAFRCKPQGVPRMGAPNRILHLGNEIILFHGNVIRNFRIGEKRNPDDLLIETWNGVPEAHWDGDTLVVESIGFNEQSWLGWGGFIHSFDLKVTERFTRVGNTLHYESVAEDPMLIEPFKARDQQLRFGPNQNATIPEATPCEDRDSGRIPNNRRG